MSKLRADEFVNSDDNGAPSFPHSATVPAPTADDHFATKLYADTSASTKSSSITNTISNTAPSNPSVGDFWTNTSQNIISLNIWNGSSWANVKNSIEISAGQIVTPPSISDPNGGYIPTMLTATSAVVSDATLSSSKWYKDDVEIPGATGFQYYATDTGTYKYEEIWVDTFGTQLFPSLSAVIDARAGVIDAQPIITSSNGVYSPTTLTATAAVVSNATLVGSKWYKDGVEVPGETGPSINILAHEGGIYKYEETWTDHFGTQLLPTLSASVQVFATIATPSVLSPADDTGVPDFDYTALSSAITNIVTTPLSSTELVDATIRTPHQTFSSSEANYNSAIWDPVNNKIVIAYSDGSNNYGKMRTANMHFDGNNYALQFSPEFTFNSSGTYDVNVVYAGNGKIVVSYLNTGENRSESKVGTYQAHLGQYSFGSPESITGSTTYASYMQSVYDPINDKVVISYNDGGDNSYGKLRVGTISGTSISYGSPSTFEYSFVVQSGIVHDPTTQKIVIAYKSGQTGKCRTATVSGTNISLGPAYEFRSSSAADWVTAVQDPNSDRIVFAYHNVNGFTRVVKVNSDDSFTFGPEQTFNSGYTHYEALTYHSPTNKIVLSYQDRGPGASYDHGKVITGSIDPTDNTITFNNPSKFNLDDTSSILYTSIVHETLYDKVAVFSRELLNGSYSGKAIVITDVGGPVQVTEDGKTLTLTDTTVSKVSDGSLIGGTSIDQVLTVGETVQADTTIATTVTTPVFNSALYTGNGNGAWNGGNNTVPSGLDFTEGDWLSWIKVRDAVDSHFMSDSTQKTGTMYDSFASDREYGKQTGESTGISVVGTDSYTIDGQNNQVNGTGKDYVAWNFKAAPGFFDIVQYAGNSTGSSTGPIQEVPHSLGSAPGCMMIKNLDTNEWWIVYHKDLAASECLYLNQSNSKETSAQYAFNNTRPTSTHFTVGQLSNVNMSGNNFIAYLFADTPGLIKCGNYTAPNPAGVLTVNTGFQPHWVMVKCISVANTDWAIFDKNLPGGAFLRANQSSAQDYAGIVFESTGFKINDYNNAHYNNAGAEFIYIAIAENAEADITTQSTASGTVSASSGNTITLSDVSGTWSTGTKVQGVTTDAKDNPDPINPSAVSLTSSEPATTQGSVTTWGNAQWQIAEDSGFTTNVQSLTSALTSSGTQTGPTGFTLDYNKNYYVRTKYGSSNPAGIFSNWSVASLFKTKEELIYADDVFSTYLYEGNADTSGSQTINNGIDLSGEGGFVWIKNRRTGGGHTLYDTERGATQALYTTTDVESARPGGLTAFNNNGFTVGNYTDENAEGQDLVAWTFRKAPGFFDVVTWTGTNDGTRISHNLGSLPGMIMVKNLDNHTENWRVYVKKEMWVDNAQYAYHRLELNTSSTIIEDVANIANADTFNPQSMGSEASGKRYVAYIFAHDDARFGTNGDESIIKCGTYEGTGSSNNFVELGFEPQWLLYKNADGTDQWEIVDMMRGMPSYNPQGNSSKMSVLRANLSSLEQVDNPTEPTPTGFNITNTGGSNNDSGSTYIYMAIRRPHKPPTAGTEVFDVGLRSGSGSVAKTNSSILTDMSFILRRDSSSEYNGLGTRLQGDLNLRLDSNSAEGAGWARYSSSWPNSGAAAWDTTTGFYVNGGNGASNTGNLIDYSFKRAPGFFDVVNYVGTSSARTQSHNLGVPPELIMVKSRNTSSAWYVYAEPLGNQYSIMFNDSEGKSGPMPIWNYTSPTSSVFSLADWGYNNNHSGDTYIALLFASLDGISKVGSYTGTGGNINVDCGFETGARFVMIKRTDGVATNGNGDWYVFNTTSGITSGNDPYMVTNERYSEVTNTDYIDPLSTGFTVTSSAPANINTSGGEYLFFAIA